MTVSPEAPLVPGGPSFATILGGLTAREVALDTRDVALLGHWSGTHQVRDLAVLLAYAHSRRCMGRSRRIRMDVSNMVRRWTDALVALSTAHDADAHDAGEAAADELLWPLLEAPIAQVREFTVLLAAALEADPRVPFLIWRSVRRIVEPVVRASPDGPLIELKADMARQVAILAESGLERMDLVDAIAGALQWRDESKLVKVKEALESGAKPRLRGRESCLFLVPTAADGTELAEVLL